jgi:ATP-dependent Lon protease
MSASTSPVRSLPSHPSEEFLHKEAKRFAREHDLQLATAQRELAHEYGFRNWAELMSAVHAMGAGSDDGGSVPPPPDSSQPDANARDVFPFLPLRGLVAFPHVSYPIFVGRPSSIGAVMRAGDKNRPIVLCAQRDALVANPSSSDIFEVGTVANVSRVEKLQDDTLKILVEGKTRIRITQLILDRHSSMAETQEIEEAIVASAQVEDLVRFVVSAFVDKRLKTLASVLDKRPGAWSISATSADGASVLADRIASELPMDLTWKQALLETIDPVQRLEKLLAVLKS